MRLLVDAHAVIWAVDDPSKLGPQAATALQDQGNDLLLSAGAIWEIAIKVGLGKLTLSMSYRHSQRQSAARQPPPRGRRRPHALRRPRRMDGPRADHEVC